MRGAGVVGISVRSSVRSRLSFGFPSDGPPRRAPLVAAVAVSVCVLAAACSPQEDPYSAVSAKAGGAAATGVDSVVAPGVPGFSTGYGILEEDAGDVELDVEQMARSGARWLRLDLSWAAVESTRGTYDWSAPDRVIDAARARGLQMVALAGYAPEWAAQSPEAVTSVFASFVAAAAERYRGRGVAVWEIWNEPNVRQFWGTNPDPHAYASLLRAAVPAIKDVDPTAYVLSGGLAPTKDRANGLTISSLTFLEALMQDGALDEVDGVAVHAYGYPMLPSESGADDRNGFAVMPRAHQMLTEVGHPEARVWVTEFGAPTGASARAVTQQRQAEIVAQGFALVRTLPWAGPLLVYCLRDTGTDPEDVEQNFGLVRHDFTPKPALAAFEAASR